MQTRANQLVEDEEWDVLHPTMRTRANAIHGGNARLCPPCDMLCKQRLNSCDFACAAIVVILK